MEKQGYHATGLNQILAESGTPKGSLYYYFPGGKEELAASAIEQTGLAVSERIANGLAGNTNTAEAIDTFIQRIANGVEASGFQAGGPLATVAMETATTNERLNLACRKAYDRLQRTFYDKLVGEFSEPRAAELATFITAAIEGGIILSRTNHDGAPLRRVAAEIRLLLTK
jgi:TetR/AcrR family transcriptional repressor of lmrAB and yxaGH operons